MRIALIHDVFLGPDGPARLTDVLAQAARGGATLAILPELPLNRWCPATPEPDDADAEPPGGSRATAQLDAARAAGIGLIGGTLVLDGERRNRALVIDEGGSLVGTYDKIHLPDEPGFHEVDHYRPGETAATPFEVAGLRFGVQVCSDINRLSGAQLLAAAGAEAVLVPRATERASWARWRLSMRANAVTNAVYVLSANRPGPEVGIGGPSVAIDPDGEVFVESEDPVSLVDLDPEHVTAARKGYPGYLPYPASVYAAGWSALHSSQSSATE